MILSNLISPFSVPLTYDVPLNKGFICFPHSSAEPAGFGSPWKNEETGETIFPGTPGGPMPNVLLYQSRRDWKWKRKVGPAVQGVGPIDWWGPAKKPEIPQIRHILSYWGPTSRHFADGLFVYGSDPKHNEIYYEGRVCAVAPYPVTGACLQTFVGSSKRWIVAVVWTGVRETVMRIEFGTLYGLASITDEKRIELKRMFSTVSAPNGWRAVADIVGPDYANARPETPWFFNKSGTEARSIRRRLMTFDSGSGVVEEIRNEQFKVVVTTTDGVDGDAGNATANKEYAPNPYTYVEDVKKHRSGIWTSPADAWGETHDWMEDYATILIEQTGRQPVAVDFIEDQVVACDLVIDVYFQLHQDWMYGMDPSNTGMLHPNTGQEQNWQPGSYTTEPRGHQALKYTGLDANNYLEWTYNGTVYKAPVEGINDMTATEFQTGTYDPSDPWRFWTQHYRGYVRYLDIRNYLMQLRTKDYQELAGSGVLSWKLFDKEGIDREAFDSAYVPFDETNPEFTNEAFTLGWDRTTMLSWELDFEYVWGKNSYVGARPTDNDSGAKGNAYPYGFYPEPWVMLKEGWRGLELFRHIYFTADAGFAQTPAGDVLMSMTLYSLAKGDGSFADWVIGTEPYTMSAETGGMEQLYPLGVA